MASDSTDRPGSVPMPEGVGRGRFAWLGALPIHALQLLVSVLGVWALAGWICVFTFRSFEFFYWLSLGMFAVTIPGAALLIHRAHRRSTAVHPPDASEDRAEWVSPTWSVALAGLACCGVVMVLWPKDYELWPVFGGALVYLGIGLWVTRPKTSQAPRLFVDSLVASRRDLLSLLFTMVVVAVLILGFHRPDRDDAYYFSEVLFLLDHPQLAMLAFDSMHGELGVPIQQLAHRPQLFEPLQAVVARLTGMPALVTYYAFFPVFWGCVGVIAQWCLLRELIGRHAWLALPINVLVLCAWATPPDFGWAAVGDFSYTRMMHGKAVLVTVMIPAVTCFAARFAKAPTPFRFFVLSTAQYCAVMATSTALVLVPIVTGICVLAFSPWRLRSWRRAVAALVSLAPIVAVALVAKHEVAMFGADLLDAPRSEGRVWMTFGGTKKAAYVLWLVAALPLLLTALRTTRTEARSAVKYLLCAFVFVFNPWTGDVLGDEISDTLSWRVYWTIPLPTLIAASIASTVFALMTPWARHAESQREKVAYWGSIFLVSVAFHGFLSEGRWLYEDSEVSWKFGKPKVELPQRRVARYLVENARPHSTVLAPPGVARAITSFHEPRPDVVAVYPRYLEHLSRYWGDDETRDRDNMYKAITKKKRNAGHYERMIRQADERCVDLVVLNYKVRGKKRLKEALKGAGFKRVRRTDGFHIWKRPLPAHCLKPDRMSRVPWYEQGKKKTKK